MEDKKYILVNTRYRMDRASLHNLKKEIADYEHFSIPFILAVDALNKKIRNLRYRYIVRQMSLFPNEVDQYDPYIIRELLHNCTAHQNYYLKGRINVIM